MADPNPADAFDPAQDDGDLLHLLDRIYEDITNVDQDLDADPNDFVVHRPFIAMAVNHREAAAIPVFAGTIGAEAKVFIDTVDDMKRLHTWTDAQTYNTAITRLTSEAKRWFKQLEPQGCHPTKWDRENADNQNVIYLKQSILDRFYDVSTAKQRVAATKDLKQRADEDIRLFHDRVVEACMISTNELKGEANYGRILKNAVKQQLINGALEHLASAVTLQADIPDDPRDILKIMVNATNKNKTEPILGETLATNAPADGSAPTYAVAAANQYQPRRGSNQRGPPRGLGPRPAGPRTRCFNCNSFGHFSRDCPRPRKPRNGNGNGNNGRGNGHRGGYRNNVHATHVDHAAAFYGTQPAMAQPMLAEAEPFTVSIDQGN